MHPIRRPTVASAFLYSLRFVHSPCAYALASVRSVILDVMVSRRSRALSGFHEWVSSVDRSRGGGPREDQKGVVGWFESQGWKTKWPLHHAALVGDDEAIRKLAGSGMDPNLSMTDHLDLSPLHWAAVFGRE